MASQPVAVVGSDTDISGNGISKSAHVDERSFGIFDFRYDVGTVAKESPTLGDASQKLRLVLQSGPIHNANRLLPLTQSLQGLNKDLLVNSRCKIAGEPDMFVRRVKRVDVTKHIGHKRQITAAARRGGEGAAGDRDNKNGGFVTH